MKFPSLWHIECCKFVIYGLISKKSLFQSSPCLYCTFENAKPKMDGDWSFLIVCADFLEHKMGYFVEFACWDVPCEQVSCIST